MRKASYSVTRLQNHGYVFILPTLLFFTVFLIYPMLSAFRYSLLEWNALRPAERDRLEELRRDGEGSARHQFSPAHAPLQRHIRGGHQRTGLRCLRSCSASRLIRYKNFLQSLFFLPVILSLVAVGVVWEFMYQSTGLIPVILRALVGSSPAWLTNTKAAPYALIIVYTWKSVGYYMVIYVAGLMDISPTFYEAARMDGAGFWDQLLYITIPNLRNTFALAVISCIIFTFGQFSIQYVITRGGPSQSTEILAMLIFREAFELGKFGYSAAVSVLFFLMLLVFSIFQLRLFRSGAVGE